MSLRRATSTTASDILPVSMFSTPTPHHVTVLVSEMITANTIGVLQSLNESISGDTTKAFREAWTDAEVPPAVTQMGKEAHLSCGKVLYTMQRCVTMIGLWKS